MPNRLAAETSPYLKQHAHNPVDWYPWGPEAFEKARREDKPVFLSIGYSSCHWCHVMERESFESEEVARLLNESWVSIKVDREERPDVDDVYMTAVQLTTGQGGWPLSAFLLPDGRPFFGGTYFPPEDRHGRAGFRTLLARLADAWRTRRADVEESAAQLAREIADSAQVTARGEAVALSTGTLPFLTQALRRSFDGRLGGFGGAPKFPPHLALEWLLGKGVEGDAEALSMAIVTLDAMALGGIHDHLGGGFHRYSTDAEWLVPHFEKMLTDNAQLLGLYARAFAVTGRDLYRSTARDTGDYLLREMRGPEGGFYAATDADSEGEEGKYFVFSEEEIRDVLETQGEDVRGFLERYGVRPGGNFHDEASGRATGLNILHLSSPLSFEEEQRLKPLRDKLLAARSRRVPPGLDDKRVAGWNALAVSGFAIASRALNEPRYLEAARAGTRFLLGSMRDGAGRLLRTWKDGEGKIPAFLEDEAFLANALLDLSEAEEGDAASSWLQEARKAVDDMRRRFRRRDGPGFTFTGEGHEELLMRGRDLFDKAVPSASGSAVRALVRLARKTGDAALAGEARAAIEEVSWLMSRAPHGTESWFLGLADLLEFEKEHGGTKERTAEKGRRDGDDAVRDSGASGVASAASSSKGITGASVVASVEPVRVEASLSSRRVRRGERFSLLLKLTVAEGWYLAGTDGLAFEVWAGSDIAIQEGTAPEPTQLRHDGEKETGGFFEEGYEGTMAAAFSFLPSKNAALGARTVSILVRYRACGEGACRPEAVLSLSVPFELF